MRSDFDFTPFTNLTWLSVSLAPTVRVTFPTGLKGLALRKGQLGNTNIGDLALESFESGWNRLVTRDDLEKLPKTVRTFKCVFEPESLVEHLSEMFPLFQK